MECSLPPTLALNCLLCFAMDELECTRMMIRSATVCTCSIAEMAAAARLHVFGTVKLPPVRASNLTVATDPNRRGMITGSNAINLLERSYAFEQQPFHEGILRMYSLSEFKGNPYTRAGTAMEPFLAEQYVKWHKEQNLPGQVVRGRFCRHPDFPYLGSEADLNTIDADGFIIRTGELKWKGKFPKRRVYRTKDGKPPAYHTDQIHMEMETANAAANDILIASEVNTERYETKNDRNEPNSWWSEVLPRFMDIYEKFQRWYWEEDDDLIYRMPLLKLLIQENLKRASNKKIDIPKFFTVKQHPDLVLLAKQMRARIAPSRKPDVRAISEKEEINKLVSEAIRNSMNTDPSTTI